LRSDEERKLEARATFHGFDEYADVDVSRRNLPHWFQAGTTCFVTFRLADSLPAEKLAQLEEERSRWLAHHPLPWSDVEKREYYDRFPAKIDEWLDAGYGSCILAKETVARIVADALRHFDGARYDLGAWVVMPNHVHALVAPKQGHDLGAILHSWKSFTANQINKQLGRSGPLWQHESYDHIVRNEEALLRITEYIERNPEKAGITVAQASSLRSDEERKLEARATYVGLEPPPDPENWQQDPDTLDTWFSSWLWAYETMDEETRRKFYPTAALVTGPDIIFFWVARMIIAGLEFKPGKSDRLEDNIPFRDVFLTGLIRDKQGRKMSKSLGNSPDPLDLIGKYGADGLRFGLMRIAPSGQDIAFDEKQIEEGRNFATKLWNAARFRQMHGPSDSSPRLDQAALSIYSIEVLARFNELLAAIENAYREYKFNEVAQRLYDFFWGDYCDWFVEAAKTDIFSEDETRKESVLAVMDFVLSGFLRLLHPFMPHITEELWSLLGLGTDTIQFALLPVAALGSTEEQRISAAREKVAKIYESVEAGRNLRATSRVPSNKKARFVLRPAGGIENQELPTLSRLLNAEELKLDPDFQPEAGVPVALTPLGELFLIVVTADKAGERERLDKEIARLEGELRTVETKLSNASFVERAPAAVVQEHQQRKKDFSEQLAQLRQARAAMD
jgi:valyl-tRNA synthetase